LFCACVILTYCATVNVFLIFTICISIKTHLFGSEFDNKYYKFAGVTLLINSSLSHSSTTSGSQSTSVDVLNEFLFYVS